MKFQRSKAFDSEFVKVAGIRWYPYVGKNFGSRGRRVMIYAHNIPIKPDEYELKLNEWSDPETWADTIDEYTYDQGWWTNAFRYFIKGAVGLKENFNASSEDSVISRVDDFVHEIAYLNFIQDLVKGENQMASPTQGQIEVSQRINRELLRILNITHCICWGKSTYEYLKTIEGVRIVMEQSENKTGFSSCVADVGGGGHLHVLRVYHPSMPSFGPFSEVTHGIISEFLTR